MAKKNMSAHLLVAPEKLARKGVGVDEIQNLTSSPNRSRSPQPDRKCTKETRLMPQELVTLKSHKEQQVRPGVYEKLTPPVCSSETVMMTQL